jgi:diguanylate cyclase (GGDEF)-like protein
MVSSAVALIAVTNFCVIRLLGHPGSSPEQLISAITPIALPTSVAVILVMSALYHRLLDLLADADRRESALVLKAGRDALTGLASRHLFEDRLVQSLIRFRRTGEPFAVIMLDLDHFKRVNDVHGHQVGDELLKHAAQRLTRETRDGDTVARFGGDEFLILVNALAQPTDVRRLCTRICAELQKPYSLGTRELRLPASLGAVLATDQLHHPSDYVRAADMALYQAKESGRNCFRFFSDELEQGLKRRDCLETDLRAALQNGGGTSVHFQPQIASTGEVIGVEALFRWTHPRFGEISPCEAVEIAEESDLIECLGEFVFRTAAAFARSYPQLSVALNLSAAQFSR